MGEGAWFCIGCRQALQPDNIRLKEIQKKLLFLQEKYRQSIPEIAHRIDPGEFIYFVLLGATLKRCWVVTDRKFIASKKADVTLEAAWSDVVGVTKPQFNEPFSYDFNVSTFKGETKVAIPGGDSCWELYSEVMKALGNYSVRKNDIRAIICSLKL